MESLQKDKMLAYNKDTLEAVRKLFNLNKPGMMKDAVDILEEWANKQHHFTQKTFDRRYLETTIIASKGSIETAKSKLDKACTLRTLMPHLFEIDDIRHYFKTELTDLKFSIMPKMTKDNERVVIYRNSGQKFGPYVINYLIRTISNVGEYMRRNDYSLKTILVVDYADVNLSAVVGHIGLREVQEIVAVCTGVCGFRLKAVYFISPSKLVEIIITLFKQVLSAKLGARIHVLKNRDALKKVIDKNILPLEYGGTDKTLDELHEDWIDAVTTEDHKTYLKQIFSARTDESRRQKDTFNEQYLGMPGTFRTISLD